MRGRPVRRAAMVLAAIAVLVGAGETPAGASPGVVGHSGYEGLLCKYYNRYYERCTLESSGYAYNPRTRPVQAVVAIVSTYDLSVTSPVGASTQAKAKAAASSGGWTEIYHSGQHLANLNNYHNGYGYHWNSVAFKSDHQVYYRICMYAHDSGQSGQYVRFHCETSV